MTYRLCKLLRLILHKRANIRPIGKLHNGEFCFYRVRNYLHGRCSVWLLELLCQLNNHLVCKLHWTR